MEDFDNLPEEVRTPRKRREDKQRVFDVYQKRRRMEIDINAAIERAKELGANLYRDGGQWVILDNGREIRNATRRKVIKDWMTINGYRVVGADNE